MSSIELSVIVLAWDALDYTRRCVESIRSTTDVPYELIIVDNGSQPPAASYADDAADVAVLHATNLGFAPGMNSGLARAGGTYVAFVNNDTVLPDRWASRLLGTFETAARPGIVLPAVTAAGNPYAVRAHPGEAVVEVPPFRHLPSGVVYLMRTAVIRELGGWDERYLVASREDLDLLFSVWCNGLEVILDERVLVEHASNVTATTMLEDRDAIWRRNRDVFIDKWTAADHASIPKLAETSPDAFANLLEQARTVALWMQRLFEAQDRLETARSEASETKRALSEANRRIRSLEKQLDGLPGRRLAKKVWPRLKPLVPEKYRDRFLADARKAYRAGGSDPVSSGEPDAPLLGSEPGHDGP